MKALSLWQPWASAIFAIDHLDQMVKPDETRHWPTKIRGRIAIHAAKRKLHSLEELTLFNMLRLGQGWRTLPYGCLIGTVELVDCVRAETVKRQDWQMQWGNYTPGRYAFVLAKAKPLKNTIPCTGRQGFFNVDDIEEGE
jgi:activating signal cointegrator 1